MLRPYSGRPSDNRDMSLSFACPAWRKAGILLTAYAYSLHLLYVCFTFLCQCLLHLDLL